MMGIRYQLFAQFTETYPERKMQLNNSITWNSQRINKNLYFKFYSDFKNEK